MLVSETYSTRGMMQRKNRFTSRGVSRTLSRTTAGWLFPRWRGHVAHVFVDSITCSRKREHVIESTQHDCWVTARFARLNQPTILCSTSSSTMVNVDRKHPTCLRTRAMILLPSSYQISSSASSRLCVSLFHTGGQADQCHPITV